VAGKREGIATERLRKDPIVAVVADNVPRAPVVVEAGTACGRGVGANIVDLVLPRVPPLTVLVGLIG
jgi:hypothetical protein